MPSGNRHPKSHVPKDGTRKVIGKQEKITNFIKIFSFRDQDQFGSREDRFEILYFSGE
jgi:hypothetical protein